MVPIEELPEGMKAAIRAEVDAMGKWFLEEVEFLNSHPQDFQRDFRDVWNMPYVSIPYGDGVYRDASNRVHDLRGIGVSV